MTRRGFMTAIGVPVLGTTVPTLGAAQSGFAVSGPLDATEGERLEGYAKLGDGLVIVVHPKGPLYQPLMELVGREVRLEIAPK